MKKMKIRRFLPALLAIGAGLLLSSCNRGYGCPTNFSLDVDLFDLAGAVLMVIL